MQYLPTRGGGVREGEEMTSYSTQVLVLESILYVLSMCCQVQRVRGWHTEVRYKKGGKKKTTNTINKTKIDYY